MELNLQIGFVKGSDAHRLVLPDFEFDLGILENLELDVDGTYSVAGQPDGKPLVLDHSAPDNLWVSAKVGLYDGRDDAKHAWAFGLQVGPKLPTGGDQHGVGVEGLALLARMDGRVHLVLGIGGLDDPHLTATPRPWGFETGLDLNLDLDDVDHWSLLGEVAFQWFGSPESDPVQRHAGHPVFAVRQARPLGGRRGRVRILGAIRTESSSASRRRPLSGKTAGCGSPSITASATTSSSSICAPLPRRRGGDRRSPRWSRRCAIASSASAVMACSRSCPRPGAIARMRVLNTDGSEAEMCGNGIRCVVEELARPRRRRRRTRSRSIPAPAWSCERIARRRHRRRWARRA